MSCSTTISTSVTLLKDFPRSEGTITVGVLSDTHGHLYPQVRRLLHGVDYIIHAGDVGSPQVLTGLRVMAPVTAVRGNCDIEPWASSLPPEAEVELGGVRILVGHMAGRLRETLAREQGKADVRGAGDSGPSSFRVVVSGHTHRVESEERDGVLHLNPGSAGPERFGHPRTMARLHITPPAQDHVPAQVSVEFLVVPET
jgi:putative phosphoesterase